MSEFVHNTVEIADRIKTILEYNADSLDVKKVYYGRTDKIPDYPAICVESGTKTRSLEGEGASRRWDVRVSCEIYIYFGRVDTAEANTRKNELLTEAVEAILHEHLTLDGSVIFGFATRIEPGVSVREQTMVKVSRVTWEARSRQTF